MARANPRFLAGLFIKSTLRQRGAADERVKKKWYMHAMGYYLAIKKK